MKIKKIILLTLTFVLIFNTFSMANERMQNIAVEFNTVNITIDGNPAYAGNILYNGTTYVPIRATANMLDCKVEWDEKTSTAIITHPTSNNGKYIEIYDYLEKLNNFYFNANFVSFCVLTAENGIYDWDYLDSEFTHGYKTFELLKDICEETADLYEDILKNKDIIDVNFSTKVEFEILYNLFEGLHDAFKEVQLINQSLETYDKENIKLMDNDEIFKSAKYLSSCILLSSASRGIIYSELTKLK